MTTNERPLEPLLSIEEAARILGVSRTTVRRLIVEGDLPCIRTSDAQQGRTLIEPAALRRYIDSRRRVRRPA